MNARRRLLVAAVALAISGIVLRPQVSSAMLTRGDTLAFAGRREAAFEAYRKALLVDPSNAAAVDRYVFAASLSRDRKRLADAIAVAKTFLKRYPADGVVLMDRALCFQRLEDYRLAAADFRDAGKIRRDARALMFAALDEKRLHDRALERVILMQAISVDHGFLPAAAALARDRR